MQQASKLETLPLWMLGSSHRRHDQALRAKAAGRGGPSIMMCEPSKWEMANGNYPAAVAEPLGADATAVDIYLRICALHRAGRSSEARRLHARVPLAMRDETADRFLLSRFG